jgi:FKBP-type peptidyl-prolyl cis-trans isomerase 2
LAYEWHRKRTLQSTLKGEKVMTSNRELRVGDRVQHVLTKRKGTIIEIDGNTVLVRWTHRLVDDTVEEAADLILI